MICKLVVAMTKLNFRSLLSRRGIAEVHGVYFVRGWTRVGLLISTVNFVNILITMLIVVVGFRPINVSNSLPIAALLAAVLIGVFLSVTYFGYWDYGRGGLAKHELWKTFEKNPMSLITWDTILTLMDSIGKNEPIPEDVKNLHEWIKASRKKLDV